MYVCVCLAITQDEVSKAIDDGATSREEVTRACRAGGDCGACHGMIEQMIEDRVDCGYSQADESGPIIPATALVKRRSAA